ncbi:RagB/SusD family nutrient uptake outer membrane protein [Flavivirga algicola]|uniref:RagB/SusD family nutrient uptake outer membrane protein n=1 Tax=Flavivirga algicola TaxID=2729136 RepID=A0ABX1RS69_9FLAO|nr:RagB/SusD family nutrient uptake outer membrane protein [Flavivirga algicola]NMH86016.1 RagB/SusD family nutrient uptake outer membrane protein [Flavivirga algicola]
MKILNRPLLFLMLLGLSFIITNCERETTENNTTTASFNSFEELVQGRLSSIYATLRSNAVYRQGGILGTWSDVGIDTHSGTLFPVEYNPLYAYTYSSGSLLIGQTWTEYYIAIKQINTFLGQIRTFEGSSTEAERNPVIAEARFLRALFYFDLVKIWGNVPLAVDEGITLDVVRQDASLPNSPADEVYLQIIEDLEFAKANGPSRVGSNPDVASREAAQALLGKVYLQMTTTKEFGGVEGGVDASGNPVSVTERFTQAERELREVITSGAFTLEPNYSDIFSNEGNNEVIFSVGYDGPNNQVGGDFGDFLGEGNIRDGGSFAAYRANIDFVLEFLRPDGIVDPDGDGSTISPTNLLPAGNPDFINVGNQNFRNEVLLLGADHFVGDERWSHNIARFNPADLALILRGDREDTELNRFNLNLNWTRWSPYKYIKPIPNPNSPGDGTIDFPYLRYADVLLMEAEALNALGRTDDAKDYVNMVIARSIKPQILTSIPEFVDPNASPQVPVNYVIPTQTAPGTPASILNAAINNNLESTDPDNYLLPDGLSQDEMLDAIVLERNKELCFEGKRKDDLIRTGRLDDMIDALHVNSMNAGTGNQIPIKQAFDLAKHTHWPIPQEEIILNPNLQQNCQYGSSPAGCFE